MSEEILQNIKDAVENAVDNKINGKLLDIKRQLNSQDELLSEVKELVAERAFIIKLWAVMKFVGGVTVSIASTVYLYIKLRILVEILNRKAKIEKK